MEGSVLGTLSRCVVVIIPLFGAGCVSNARDEGMRIDNVPMYGQPEIVRSETLKKADEEFIAQAISGFRGSREAASDAWHQQGELFLSQKNFDFAMRRYNQAWLLNPQSYKPYWGFSRVLVQRRDMEPAIKFMEKSLFLCNDSFEKPALIADLGAAWSVKARSLSADRAQERANNFAAANARFQESVAIDATWWGAWRSWAISLYEEGKYAEAWEKVGRAQALNQSAISSAFIDSLSARMPRPREE